MNLELEKLIGGGATPDKIADAARKNGMRSLFESGLQHVLQGDTSIEELLRVVDVPVSETAAVPVVVPAPLPAAGARPSGPVPAVPRRTPPSQPIPAVAATLEPDVAASFDLIDEGGTGGQLAPSAARSACVLLVDDEDQLRRVMKDLLARDGYEVVEARDGAEALDQVDRHAPDVIVLDLNLPGRDGYSVLSELRARPLTRRVPIIVLTAKGDEDNEVRVFDLGADDFLTKPFRARALSKRLEVVLARRRG